MNNFLIPLINSFVLTACFLLGLIAFQADIANWFGIASINPAKFSLLKDLILPIFAAFGGAISGAYIAFSLQSKKEETLTVERNLSCVNRTLFTLHMQMTDLLNIKEQSFRPQQDNPVRFLQILPMVNNSDLSDKINMDIAQILINAKKPQLIQDILIAEKKYFSLMHLFQIRNELKNDLDMIMEEHDFGHGTSFRLGQLLLTIGPQNLAKIYDTTEMFIKMLDESVLYYHQQINCLIKESGRIFKDQDKKRVELVPDEQMKKMLKPLSKPHFKTKEDLFEYLEADLKDLKANNQNPNK